jgi:microcompartment protein CcmK/EutM
MQICRVVGSTVSTVKAPGLAQYKLLNVRPARAAGDEFVALDAVGAGVGDLVLVATGSAVRELEGLRGVAADAAVVAIVDEQMATR